MLTPYPSRPTKQAHELDGKFLSVVVPIYNEEQNIKPLLARLSPVMEQIGLPYEIILVDDGSKDNSAETAAEEARKNPRVKLICFSRNFGKEAALNAGLAHAKGDGVIQLDADLQHPPEIIFDFIREWQEGGEIVFGARRSRESETFMRRILAKTFYRVFSAISDVKLMEGLGDFLLLDRKVVDAILSLPERERFTKGLYAWVGFKRQAVPFEVAPRAAGQSGWSIFKLFRFAMNAITSFGSIPLKVWSYLGLVLALSSLGYAGVILFDKFFYGSDVRGYPALMAAICFFSGVQLLGLGIFGEYLSRVMAEVKQRPLYLVQEKVGFEDDDTAKREPTLFDRIAS